MLSPNFFATFSHKFCRRSILKIGSKFFKTVLMRSVPSSKQPGFDRIRDFRDIEWCWDHHFFQHFLTKFGNSILENASKPLENRFTVLCVFEKTAGLWQHLSLQKEWMMLRSTFLPTFSHMLTSSKSFQRALYLRAKSRFLTEFDASKRMRSTFLPVRFSKLFQNLLKAVLTCSVLSSKRLF